MKRDIYVVYASIVDANGTFNMLPGYPKTFDSRNYNNDCDKALLRAKGEYHDTFGAMCKRDDRQLQTVLLTNAAGMVFEQANIGHIADIPDEEE